MRRFRKGKTKEIIIQETGSSRVLSIIQPGLAGNGTIDFVPQVKRDNGEWEAVKGGGVTLDEDTLSNLRDMLDAIL